MATVAPARNPLAQFRAEAEGMNTIPDPRSPSPASFHSRVSSPGSMEHHPDLSKEVATLSTKLINAINHQTALDDTLQETRHELDQAREQIARLEKAAKDHQNLISQGLLMKKEDVDLRNSSVRNDLQREIQQREAAEKEKRRMESELENLTATLFEEANTMVADARKQTDTANHKIEQLKGQLLDSENLLSSQQEQLQDLKAVMQQMSEKDENEGTTHVSSMPSTPGLAQGKMSRMFDAANLTPVTPEFAHDAEPQPPLFYHQLLAPTLRTDLPAYQDFQSLLKTCKDVAAVHSATSSRVNSGNFSALSSMSIGLGSSSNMAYTHAFHQPSSATPPQTPKLPASAGTMTSNSPRDSMNITQAQLPPLKEAKYFKRVLPEDIEPTLRLDLAPGLSWLNKRSVLSGIIGGSLAIEPAPKPVSRSFGPVYQCALCGENGKQEKYARKHQFRVAEDGTEGDLATASGIKGKAQRWPLCDWCLGRIRSTCDFIGFLRMCQAGMWKADTPERAKEAWEEGVRLRERMFWSRVGGGVVPSFITKSSDDLGRASADSKRSEDDLFKPKAGDEKRASIGKAVIERKDSATESKSSTPTSEETEEQLARQLSAEMRIRDDATPQPSQEQENYVDAQKTQATVTTSAADSEKPERLSVTIPGSFA